MVRSLVRPELAMESFSAAGGSKLGRFFIFSANPGYPAVYADYGMEVLDEAPFRPATTR